MKSLPLTVLIFFLLIIPVFAQEQDYQTKQDILQTYGKPFWKGEGEQREVWHYPHKKMFIYFEEDKVVEIDVVTGEKI